MKRLYDRYQPSLDEIVGQPDLWEVRNFAEHPYASCWLFTGDPGVGKSATCQALADVLADPWNTHTLSAADLSVDRARELLGVLRCVPRKSNGWNVLIVEELEWLSKQAIVFLKDKLARDLPKRAIVLATSNDDSGLPAAFLERFHIRRFQSGVEFMAAGAERVAWVWQQETGNHCPPVGYEAWGWKDGRFSLRAALDEAQRQLTLLRPCAALEAA